VVLHHHRHIGLIHRVAPPILSLPTCSTIRCSRESCHDQIHQSHGFAAHLIRAGDGKFWLYHCQSGVAPFQILSAVESLSAAKALANSHHHEGIEAERMLQRAVS